MLSFERARDEPGLTILDPVERRRCVLRTPDSVAPERVSPDRFRFPVDGAVAVGTARLAAPLVEGFVHGPDDWSLARVGPGRRERFPEGTYTVELNAAVKLFVRAPGPLAVEAVDDGIHVEADGAVTVGARSYHQHPAGTVTVPDEPSALLAALPALGSALKTTGPERSYPTLRGHPPVFERGDDLSIPDCLRPPDTGVTLELPAEYGPLFAAAPLASYFGADVREASRARLVTDRGFEHDLGAAPADEAERILKQSLFLDCLTRTEGFYGVDLAERAAVADRLEPSFAELYDRSLPEQLAAYLAVPFDAIREHVPTWAVTAHLPPTPRHVEVIPYLIDGLAVVRPASAERLSPSAVRSRTLAGFFRGRDRPGGEESGRDDGAGPGNCDGLRYVRPDTRGSVEEAWFGDGVPLGATKAVPEAFRNRLDREPRADPVDVAVVCNSAEMAVEPAVVERAYGARERLPFDVSIHRELTTGELADLFAADRDFLHYVGHVDGSGFRCSDGSFDAGTLDSVGVTAFLLNACRSYRQGIALIEGGSVGGVTTVADVVDGPAVAVGRTMARLLNQGFPLRPALTVATEGSAVADHYLVVGDGTVDVTQDRNGMPIVCDVEPTDAGYELSVRAYLPREGGMGSLAFPYLASNERHFLAPGLLGRFEVSDAELSAFLARHRCPVRIGDEIVWNEGAGG